MCGSLLLSKQILKLDKEEGKEEVMRSGSRWRMRKEEGEEEEEERGVWLLKVKNVFISTVPYHELNFL